MIRKKFPDQAKARSMLNAAIVDMCFIEKLPLTLESSQSIVRGVYENFRMLGDALLTAKGFEVSGLDHHAQMIDALTKLQIKTSRPLALLHELRKIRHQINYEGYIPAESEVKYVMALKESLWQPILAEIKRKIENKV